MDSNRNEKNTITLNKISHASSWEECGFTVELTQDGSYSLKILSSSNSSLTHPYTKGEAERTPYGLESMHHSGGALTETMYIYAPVVILSIGQFFLNNQQQSENQTRRILCFIEELLLKTLSKSGASDKDKNFFTAILSNEKFYKSKIVNHHLVLGLGLAYIECVIACVSFLFEKKAFVLETPYKISIESYEIVEELKIALKKYLFDQPHFAKPYYDRIFSQVLEFFSIDIENLTQIKNNLNAALTIKGEMKMSSLNELETYGAIYFDAFSKKTSPDLWTPEFLEKLFSLSAQNCFFSTYACTGFLKRSLQSQDFKVEKRMGFKGKRDSTFALRFAVTD